jgi:hypothetical protein
MTQLFHVQEVAGLILSPEFYHDFALIETNKMQFSYLIYCNESVLYMFRIE